MILHILTINKNENKNLEKKASGQSLRSAAAFAKVLSRQIKNQRQKKETKNVNYVPPIAPYYPAVLAMKGFCFFSFAKKQKKKKENTVQKNIFIEIGSNSAHKSARMYEEIKKRRVFLDFFFFSFFLPKGEEKTKRKKNA